MTGIVRDRSLEQRMADLEQIESIKAPMYRCWGVCGTKDPAAFRDCFIKVGASNGPLGTFDDADGIIEVFAETPLKKVEGRCAVLDMHHGFHPCTTPLSDTEASGTWTLLIRRVNRLDNTGMLGAGEYDAYVVEDGRGKVSKSNHQPVGIQRPLLPNTVVEQVSWA
ncbi:nuclear transport factor 2 family protein [Streptomyces sp. LHD-70]|uniref:nuclear transport factor 2 family protein n=1 Tax=Streptomyces sp. LHD-70 TaxID=3072140 RepID=UPI00280ECD77|nr:nuclear transport factor 2 family protein [Streptomyces sp. LHD-70]MDQ8706019.1 nuclear transport factor 2 family protein [Streptomyces sp. LHD-70]